VAAIAWLLVTHGKTESARPIVPLTARASAILQARWELTGKSEEPSSLKKQHVKALRVQGSAIRAAWGERLRCLGGGGKLRHRQKWINVSRQTDGVYVGTRPASSPRLVYNFREFTFTAETADSGRPSS
jgi:hypothetical protein